MTRAQIKSWLHEMSAHLTGTTVGVRTREQVVALTFDDGPDPHWTPQLLEILTRHQARATFFVLGKSVSRWPDLTRRLVAEGHAIGNHTWDHPSLPLLTWRGRRAQIAWTAEALAEFGGTQLFRPPYGHQTLASQLSTVATGHRVVGWSCLARDWRDDPAEAMVARIESQMKPGAIVLFHDRLFTTHDRRFEDRTESLRAVDQLISRHPDWRFVTVPELLRFGSARRRHEYTRPNMEWLRQQV